MRKEGEGKVDIRHHKRKDGKDVFRIDAYLKSFHTQSVLDYIASGAYKKQTNFQRYIGKRAERLEAQGHHVDLME